MINQIVSAIGQGLLWSSLGIGLYLTFRILNFADMTVEGSYPLGAAISVVFINFGLSPLTSVILSFIFGSIAGLVTGILYTKAKIPILLAGILTMTALYSINLQIMGGKSNLSLLHAKTLFNNAFFDTLPQYFNLVIFGLILVAIIITLIIWFLKTDLGQAFVATGDNPHMAKSLGINTDNMIILGLMLSNGIIALGGGIIAQSDGFADVNKGIGTIVISLAAIILGESIFNASVTLKWRLITICLGSIVYRFVLLAVLSIGFNANNIKLLSALVLAIALTIPQIQKKFKM